MTNLKQIQEENRNLILTAIHGCEYEDKEYTSYFLCECCREIRKSLVSELTPPTPEPITLDRVLLALGDKEVEITFYSYKSIAIFDKYKDVEDRSYYCIVWDLTKPTLEEQTEETQIAINKLLFDYKI